MTCLMASNQKVTEERWRADDRGRRCRGSRVGCPGPRGRTEDTAGPTGRADLTESQAIKPPGIGNFNKPLVNPARSGKARG